MTTFNMRWCIYKQIYYDEMVRIDGVDEDIWGRYYADIPVDWRGFMGFEVVE